MTALHDTLTRALTTIAAQKPDTLEYEWRQLGQVGAGVMPVRLSNAAPTAADALAVYQDIEFVRERFARLLAAYSDTVCPHFSDGELPDYFKQARDLIEDGFGQLLGHITDIEERLKEEANAEFDEPRGSHRAMAMGGE